MRPTDAGSEVEYHAQMTFKGVAALVSPFLGQAAPAARRRHRGPARERPGAKGPGEPPGDLRALAAPRPAARRPSPPSVPRTRRPTAATCTWCSWWTRRSGAGPARAHRAGWPRRCARPNEAYDGGADPARRPAHRGPAAGRRPGATSVHVSAEPFPLRPAPRRCRREALARDGCRVGRDRHAPTRWGRASVRKGDGSPYKVFTPFSTAWREHGWPAPAADAARPAPAPRPTTTSASPRCSTRRCADGPPTCPTAGEEAALTRWRAFRTTALARLRRRPRPPATSTARRGSRRTSSAGGCTRARCSPTSRPRRGRARTTFRNELGWREFYADVLWHQPDVGVARPAAGAGADGVRRPGRRVRRLARRPHRLPDRRRRDAPAARDRLDAQPGADGHRQLPRQGPARLVAARRPALPATSCVDGDVASNNHGWQWVAGTGTDAAPYFRRLQPGHPGPQVRPGRRLRAALGARARAPRRARRRTSRGSPTTATPTATRGGSSTTPRSGGWRWTDTGRPGGEGGRGGGAGLRVVGLGARG